MPVLPVQHPEFVELAVHSSYKAIAVTTYIEQSFQERSIALSKPTFVGCQPKGVCPSVGLSCSAGVPVYHREGARREAPVVSS